MGEQQRVSFNMLPMQSAAKRKNHAHTRKGGEMGGGAREEGDKRRDRKLAKLIDAIKSRQVEDPQVVEKPVNDNVVINPPVSSVESYLPRVKNILK